MHGDPVTFRASFSFLQSYAEDDGVWSNRRNKLTDVACKPPAHVLTQATAAGYAMDLVQENRMIAFLLVVDEQRTVVPKYHVRCDDKKQPTFYSLFLHSDFVLNLQCISTRL